MKPQITVSDTLRALGFFFTVFALTAATPVSAVFAQQDTNAQPESESKDDEKTSKDNVANISVDQSRLANQYKLLEEKLFSLYQYEADKNASRSDLLRRAFEQSKEKLTAKQLDHIVALLSDEKLKNAVDRQEDVLVELKAMLELLQSEDRGKQLKDAIQRHKEYLKEVNRVLRIQKGIRGQTEGGVDKDRLANSQEKTADRTKKLADEVKSNESGESGDPQDGNSESQNDSSGNSSDGKPSEGKPEDNKDRNDKNKDDKNDADKNDADKNKDENKSDKNNSKPSDSKGSQESKDSDGSKDSKGSQGSQGSQGSEGSQNDDSDQQPQDSGDQNPVQKKLEAAEQKMRDAQLKLEKAKRDKSIEDMKAAEKELEEAKKELEEILRQLREEEIGRTLAMLESRFRKMLERELKVYENTRRLDATVPEQRATDFEIRAGKLSVEQKSIAMEAGKALMLLLEDGSSVAFPETVQDMKEDMDQVAARLSAARTGTITQEIEEDIIETLDYLIEALVQAQQDLEEQKGGQGGGGGGAGDSPLVDQIAELKMVRGLQHRIYKRHKRYSRLLEDPDDPLGITDDPDMQHALERLSQRQEKLQRITHDIVTGKNQ